MSDPLPTLPGLPIGRLIRPNTCGTCKWSHKNGRAPQMECRESPPTAQAFPVQDRGVQNFIIHTCFPMVNADSWCGKWATKIEVN